MEQSQQNVCTAPRTVPGIEQRLNHLFPPSHPSPRPTPHLWEVRGRTLHREKAATSVSRGSEAPRLENNPLSSCPEAWNKSSNSGRDVQHVQTETTSIHYHLHSGRGAGDKPWGNVSEFCTRSYACTCQTQTHSHIDTQHQKLTPTIGGT